MLTKASLQTLHFLYNFNLKVQSLRNIEENASIFTVVSMASTFIQTKALALDSSPGALNLVIVKSGDDCRQEHFDVQPISHFYVD
ncbi:hypothetical protein SCA6_007318 [Theobroma cacao]